MRLRGSVGRADLLKALSGLDEDTREAAAELLGYAASPRKESTRNKASIPVGGEAFRSEKPLAPADIVSKPFLPTPFWRLETFKARELAQVEQGDPATMPVWRNRPPDRAPFYFLESWGTLAPKLLQALGFKAPGSEYDVDRAVKIIAQAQSLDSLTSKAAKENNEQAADSLRPVGAFDALLGRSGVRRGGDEASFGRGASRNGIRPRDGGRCEFRG